METPAKHLEDLETKLLQASVRSDPVLVGALLSEQFRELGASGRVFSRSEILDALAAEGAVQLSLTEFSAEALADGVVLVTYRSRREDARGTVREALRSSIWKSEAGQWRMIFHQGTPILS